MNNTYIATVDINNSPKDKFLSLGEYTQTNTNNAIFPTNIDFENLFENQIVLYSLIGLGLILFLLVVKSAFKPKKQEVIRRPIPSKQIKSRNETPNFPAKKEPKIKLNYATPSNINNCIRMFLERTKNK